MLEGDSYALMVEDQVLQGQIIMSPASHDEHNVGSHMHGQGMPMFSVLKMSSFSNHAEKKE